MPSPLLLLVDDDPELALVVRVLSRRVGHGLEWRPSVPAAREWLRDGQPDLVLVDVNLPGESGLLLIRELSAAPRPGQALALFSHWGVPGDVAAGLDAGADFVLSKDLVARPKDWERRVHQILGHASSHPALAVCTMPTPVRLPEAQRQVLQRALEGPALRAVPPEVLSAVLRRASASLPEAGKENRFPNILDALQADALPAAVWHQFVVRLERILGQDLLGIGMAPDSCR
jgi:CheY-like chemotaxis protein